MVNLLNGIFDENFNEDEVELNASNNEFVMDSLELIRGDIFLDLKSNKNKKITYHLEFQTKNDNTMIIRMFEYGFKKGKEQSLSGDDLETIYFPKQKVIFIEENNNIKDELKLRIVLPSEEEFIYTVSVMKYWKLSEEDIIKKKMYPLLPLQLFSLRKELAAAVKKKDYERVHILALKARESAFKLCNEIKDIYDNQELIGDDFHKMLLAIQNLIEYLNRNYFNDSNIEEEVTTMTKTLYDPAVEERGIKKGIEQGIKQGRQEERELTKKVFKLSIAGNSNEEIARQCKISEDEVNDILN